MNGRRIAGPVGALFLIAGCGVSGVSLSPAAVATSVPSVAAPVPSGYTVTNGVAWRWLQPEEGWAIEAIPQQDCPTSLYIELSMLDGSGAIVGTTNDLLGTVPAGQRARLEFPNIGDRGQKARLSKLLCY